jgi:hypothetical protein
VVRRQRGNPYSPGVAAAPGAALPKHDRERWPVEHRKTQGRRRRLSASNRAVVLQQEGPQVEFMTELRVDLGLLHQTLAH